MSQESPSRDMQDLIDVARTARAYAYAPYSKFQVGCALRLADGRVFSGVNVENSSFPLSVCAERNALAAAVRAGMKPGELVAVAVVADAEGFTTPCGGCRQVLSEFAATPMSVVMFNERDGQTSTLDLATLLPHAFGRASLQKP